MTALNPEPAPESPGKGQMRVTEGDPQSYGVLVMGVSDPFAGFAGQR